MTVMEPENSWAVAFKWSLKDWVEFGLVERFPLRQR